MLLNARQISQFVTAQRLPEEFCELTKTHYQPLAAWLMHRQHAGKPLLVGITGAQGTGKSTLAAFLQLALETAFGWRVAVLSIDDFYLTRRRRQQLAQQVHPLLATRGVPGTHDMRMLSDCIGQLKTLAAGAELCLPRFDKASDDRAVPESWPVVAGPVDLIILEGWCVGSRSQPDAALREPINALEREADKDGRWRHWVNVQLKGSYAKLFQQLDALIFLKAPSLDAVFRWRLEAEQKLAALAPATAAGIMNRAQVARFVQFYERLSRANHESLPAIADVVLELDAAHGCRRSFDRLTGHPLSIGTA